MTDRRELLNDAEEAQRLVLDGRQSCIWTALPGIVQSVDFDAMTIEVQPSIQGTVTDENNVTTFVNLPLLVDVPIVFPSAGGFTITLPIAQGDEVLVVIASRCIDAWWQSGGVQKPMEARMHDLSDAFAIPGPRSQPRVLSGVSSTDVQIRNDAGTSYISITASGKIKLTSASEIDLTAPVIKMTGAVAVIGSLAASTLTATGGGSSMSVTGTMNITGSIVASGEVTASGKALSTHIHGGVTVGSGNTGAPV